MEAAAAAAEAVAGGKEEHFEVGERIFAYDRQNMIYEAKVLKTRNRKRKNGTPTVQFYVHYLGWNDRWDEWLVPKRMLKHTPANEAIVKQLQDEVARMMAAKEEKVNAKASAAAAATTTTTTTNNKSHAGGKGKKRAKSQPQQAAKSTAPTKKARRQSIEPNGATANGGTDVVAASPLPALVPFDLNPVIRSRSNKAVHQAAQGTKLLPFALKRVLYKDWEFINRQEMLLRVPCQPSAADVLEKFLVWSGKGPSSPELPGVVEAVKSHMDEALGVCLLYRLERRQYQRLRKQYPKCPMSSLCGATHLLRLLWKMPTMIDPALPKLTKMGLVKVIRSILQYLECEASTLFGSPQYECAAPEYYRQYE